MNETILSGRITKDLEVRFTKSNVAVCNFSIAVQRKFKVNNEYVTDFFNCQTWGPSAEYLAKYGRKGCRVIISGELQNDKYDKNGTTFETTRINCDTVEVIDMPEKEKVEPKKVNIIEDDLPF